MLTNEIKKGTRILMRSGWYGTMMDNMKGNTRMVDVEGDFREIGSVYSHDITYVIQEDGSQLKVEHTKKQLDCKAMVGGMGF